MGGESKKQRPAPGSMYFPPTAVVSTPTAAPPFSPTSATTTNTTTSPKGSTPGSPYNSFQNPSTMTKALTPNTELGELLRSIEPRYCFHPAVEELLLEMATEFVQDVVGFSGKLAKHRRSNVLEPRDLQFCLAKNYGISLAGVLNGAEGSAHDPATMAAAPAGENAAVLNPLGQDLLMRARPAKNSLHMHRIALKRKALLRTKTKLLKSGRSGAKASESGGKKVVRKGSTAMDTK
uniref:Transcription initiation factor TFIID subunit 12 domain-containing protein n=1 Tax=Globisporangium ultimum (strain ATCC 200006 / CBS 805.95 / DAOM BR144) TaxID=431595 RepID=K3WH39_GLOUD